MQYNLNTSNTFLEYDYVIQSTCNQLLPSIAYVPGFSSVVPPITAKQTHI